MPYNWLYTTSNDNIYILILIIIILSLIIIDFKLWNKKTDNFNDVQNNLEQSQDYIQQTQNSIPISTMYQRPIYTNSMNPDFYISKEEQTRRNAWSQLDGNEESLSNTNGSNQDPYLFKNDITQTNSTLFNNSKAPQLINYATVGDYATLDSIGTTLTDTLGGIKTNMGYTILQDQLGTFNNYSNNSNNSNNSNTYDNTANYKTGMNPSTVNGASIGKNGSISGTGSGLSGQFTQDNKPVFLQKDFEGVANIFAPNIIILNPPLTSDGNPDISFQM